MPTNDNDIAGIAGPPPIPPADAHGQAALLLVESLIHGLLERSVLSVADAVEILGTAIAVQTDVVDAADGGDAQRRSLALLARIARSLTGEDPLPPVRRAPD